MPSYVYVYIYIYTLMMNVGIINGAWQILHSLTYRKDRFLYIGIQRFKDISAYARCLHSACTYAFGVFRYQDSTIHQEPTNKKTKPVNYYYCRMTEQPKYHEMYVYSGFKSTFVQIKSTKKAIIIIYIYQNNFLRLSVFGPPQILHTRIIIGPLQVEPSKWMFEKDFCTKKRDTSSTLLGMCREWRMQEISFLWYPTVVPNPAVTSLKGKIPGRLEEKHQRSLCFNNHLL